MNTPEHTPPGVRFAIFDGETWHAPTHGPGLYLGLGVVGWHVPSGLSRFATRDLVVLASTHVCDVVDAEVFDGDVLDAGLTHERDGQEHRVLFLVEYLRDYGPDAVNGAGSGTLPGGHWVASPFDEDDPSAPILAVEESAQLLEDIWPFTRLGSSYEL